MSYLTLALVISIVTVAALLAKTVVDFHRGKKKAATVWRKTKVDRLPDFGVTRSLTVLPLVEWAVGDDRLKRESGVSYLVRTDQCNILFDCGLNLKSAESLPWDVVEPGAS